jgi:hypothetical protein
VSSLWRSWCASFGAASMTTVPALRRCAPRAVVTRTRFAGPGLPEIPTQLKSSAQVSVGRGSAVRNQRCAQSSRIGGYISLPCGVVRAV